MPDTAASPRPLATYTAFVVCTLIWGSTFLFISIGNDTVPPVWAATLRLLLAAALLIPLAMAIGSGLPKGAALRSAACLGFFQFGLNFPLLYWGQTRVSSGLTAILFATIPLSSAMLARGFGLERLNRSKIAGAVAALAGVAIIFSGEAAASASLPALGAILVATVCAVMGTMFYKRGPRQSAIGANAVATAVGAPVCLAVSMAAGEPRTLPLAWEAVYPILYLALAGSVGAFVIFAWLVKHWDVTRASYISVLVPLVALALGVLVRHERIAWPSLLGSAVVLLGVTLGVHRRAPG